MILRHGLAPAVIACLALCTAPALALDLDQLRQIAQRPALQVALAGFGEPAQPKGYEAAWEQRLLAMEARVRGGIEGIDPTTTASIP